MPSLTLIGSWLHLPSNPLLHLVTGEKKANTLYSTTLNLALQALCLLLPRFCADTMSHSCGCISDATMSVVTVMRTVLLMCRLGTMSCIVINPCTPVNQKPT